MLKNTPKTQSTAKNNQWSSTYFSQSPHEAFDTCENCHKLKQQLNQKETYIEHLRSYQKMLTEQLYLKNEEYLNDEKENLQKLLDEHILREKSLQETLEQQNYELLQVKESYNLLKTINLELKQQIYELEMCNYEKQKEKYQSHQTEEQEKDQLIEQQQRVIEIIENDFQEVKERYEQILQKSQPESRFINSIVQFVLSCHPEDQFKNEPPNLKYVWKWLKRILEEFMFLKTSQIKQQSSSQNSLRYECK